MKRRSYIIARLFVLALFFLCLVAAAQARKITFAEYIEATEQPVSTGEASINAVLRVLPVEEACEPSGPFFPKDAFVNSFPDELREGAIVFFNRKGRFVKADKDAGNLSLALTLIEFRGGAKNRVSIKVNMKIFDTSTGVEYLVGTVSSYADAKLKKLYKPEIVPVGAEEWILKDGTYIISVVCRSMLNCIDRKIIENGKIISQKLNSK